jgi:hypothetical protein
MLAVPLFFTIHASVMFVLLVHHTATRAWTIHVNKIPLFACAMDDSTSATQKRAEVELAGLCHDLHRHAVHCL